MLPAIVQHVHEGVSHLPRRRQLPRVIPFAPDGPVTPKDAVDRLGDADRQALHAAREPKWGVGFHEQMYVIGLDGELQQTEGLVRCARERRPYRAEDGVMA